MNKTIVYISIAVVLIYLYQLGRDPVGTNRCREENSNPHLTFLCVVRNFYGGSTKTLSSCEYQEGIRWPYELVENGYVVGMVCVEKSAKGNRYVTVSNNGNVMFTGRFAGGIGNIEDHRGIRRCIGTAYTKGQFGYCEK